MPTQRQASQNNAPLMKRNIIFGIETCAQAIVFHIPIEIPITAAQVLCFASMLRMLCSTTEIVNKAEKFPTIFNKPQFFFFFNAMTHIPPAAARAASDG